CMQTLEFPPFTF
nr:immunoglobulin light chain junction region [Macaca mulatta]MOW52432.1 immunoglobulin light chain junction region [Macaca mulatta]MOW52515.1 immunoglobulin light chain junction region [Macaca mulatta]MOW53095.1 immunoglobulin light chain junction region [Macaca mulatta]MOW53113.1 immunoglobulin light chain junction region [Macaca mulatta]